MTLINGFDFVDVEKKKSGKHPTSSFAPNSENLTSQNKVSRKGLISHLI